MQAAKKSKNVKPKEPSPKHQAREHAIIDLKSQREILDTDLKKARMSSEEMTKQIEVLKRSKFPVRDSLVRDSNANYCSQIVKTEGDLDGPDDVTNHLIGEMAQEIRKLSDNLIDAEAENQSLNKRMSEIITTFETESRENEFQISSLKTTLAEKNLEVERMKQDLENSKSSLLIWMGELQQTDDCRNEWETKYYEVRIREQLLERELSILKKKMEDPNKTGHQTPRNDDKPWASRKSSCDSVVIVDKFDGMKWKFERQIHDLEAQIKTRNEMVSMMTKEHEEKRRIITTIGLEKSKLRIDAQELQQRVEFLTKHNVELERRLEVNQTDFNAKIKELLLLKGCLELDLQKAKELENKNDLESTSDRKSSLQSQLEEISEHTVSILGLAKNDATKTTETSFIPENRGDHWKAKFEHEAKLKLEMESRLRRTEAEMAKLIESFTRQSQTQLQKATRAQNLELTSSKDVSFIKSTLVSELEGVKTENMRLQTFILNSQKQFAEEIAFLREELKLTENASLEVKKKGSKSQSDKEYYQNKYNQLVSWLKKQNLPQIKGLQDLDSGKGTSSKGRTTSISGVAPLPPQQTATLQQTKT